MVLKRFARGGLEQIVERYGYTLADRGNMDRAAWQYFMTSLLDCISVDLVIDVGANEGQFRRSARQDLGYRGAGISFEPVPAYFQRLVTSCADDPEWEARQLALGAEPGRSSFNVMGEFSSFLEPSISETRIFDGINKASEVIDVGISTLDLEVPGDARIIFLKMDTQGHDHQVLAGAVTCLDRIAIIQTEIAFSPIYEQQPRAVDSINLLETLGFCVAGVYRVNNAGYPLRLVDADLILVRKDLAP